MENILTIIMSLSWVSAGIIYFVSYIRYFLSEPNSIDKMKKFLNSLFWGNVLFTVATCLSVKVMNAPLFLPIMFIVGTIIVFFLKEILKKYDSN